MDLQVHSTVPKTPEIKQLVAIRDTHWGWCYSCAESNFLVRQHKQERTSWKPSHSEVQGWKKFDWNDFNRRVEDLKWPNCESEMTLRWKGTTGGRLTSPSSCSCLDPGFLTRLWLWAFVPWQEHWACRLLRFYWTLWLHRLRFCRRTL